MVSSTVANSTVGGVAPPRATFSVVVPDLRLKPALRFLMVVLLSMALLILVWSFVWSMPTLSPLALTVVLM